MADARRRRDPNFVPSIAVSDSTGESRQLLVDEATGYLLTNASGSGGASATDDSAFTAGSGTGTPIMGFYQSSADSVDDGDVGALRMTADRILLVQSQGDVADNGADSGNPVKVGGVYNTTLPTYADGDRADLQVDSRGRLITTLGTALSALLSGAENDTILQAPFRRSDSFQATITSADASSATQVKAKTASKSIYLTDIVISVDTAMNVQLQDDAGSPVVHMEQIYMPANSVFAKTFATPIQVATNQDLDVITSTSGNISITATGYVI